MVLRAIVHLRLPEGEQLTQAGNQTQTGRPALLRGGRFAFTPCYGLLNREPQREGRVGDFVLRRDDRLVGSRQGVGAVALFELGLREAEVYVALLEAQTGPKREDGAVAFAI